MANAFEATFRGKRHIGKATRRKEHHGAGLLTATEGTMRSKFCFEIFQENVLSEVRDLKLRRCLVMEKRRRPNHFIEINNRTVVKEENSFLKPT